MLKPCWYLSAASVNSRDWWKGPLSDRSHPREPEASPGCPAAGEAPPAAAAAAAEVQQLQQQQQSQKPRAARSHRTDGRLRLMPRQLMLHPATPHSLGTGRRTHRSSVRVSARTWSAAQPELMSGTRADSSRWWGGRGGQKRQQLPANSSLGRKEEKSGIHSQSSGTSFYSNFNELYLGRRASAAPGGMLRAAEERAQTRPSSQPAHIHASAESCAFGWKMLRKSGRCSTPSVRPSVLLLLLVLLLDE